MIYFNIKPNTIHPRRLGIFEYHKVPTFFKNLDHKTLHSYFGYTTSKSAIDDLYKNYLNNPINNVFYVIELKNKIIGMCHVARQGCQAEISLVVVPDCRTHGLGKKLLKVAIDYCQFIEVSDIVMIFSPGNHKIQKVIRNSPLKPKINVKEGEANFEIHHSSVMDFYEMYLNPYF